MVTVQATEAMHSKFKDHWKRYKRNKSYPEAQRFCRALLTTTADNCKVIEEIFQLYFKYIYLEDFSKKKLPTIERIK